ncbi:MAG: hypothetical protein RIR33_2983 [Pseudomonadota bacterium]|jgi:uncharacterized membrane protein
MLKRVSALALLAAILAACSNAEADLDGDLEVGGTEPAYWTVQVDREANKATISILGEASFEGEAPVKSRGEEGVLLLTSKTPAGDFVMSFTRKDCFDGLAESARPWSVSVTWKGEILNGCAFPR